MLKAHGVQPLPTALGNVGPVYLQFIYDEAMVQPAVPACTEREPGQRDRDGSAKWTDPAFVQGHERVEVYRAVPESLTTPACRGRPCPVTLPRARARCCWTAPGTWPRSSKPTPSWEVGDFPPPFPNTAADNQAYAEDDLNVLGAELVAEQGPCNEVAGVLLQPVGLRRSTVKITGISPSQSGGTLNGTRPT